MDPRDAAGEVAAVVGVRVHHGVVDVVQIYGEHDADATRIPGDEPDIFFPYKVFWRSSGRSARMVARMPASNLAACSASIPCADFDTIAVRT